MVIYLSSIAVSQIFNKLLKGIEIVLLVLGIVKKNGESKSPNIWMFSKSAIESLAKTPNNKKKIRRKVFGIKRSL